MATKRRKPEKLHRKSPGGRRSSRRKDAEDGESTHDKSRAEGEAPGEHPSSPAVSREPSSYKTPKRMLASKSRLPTFSSPGNEGDMQQEIFWDPNSPTAYKLGNVQKKQTNSGHMVEISEIVNRIAPQDEKPTCSENSLLGLWIGDDAIPCTPGMTNIRSRTKINGPRRLRLKNREEELMKLAKQFDQNFTDAIQDQNASSCVTAEAAVSVELQAEVVGDYPKMEVTLPVEEFNQNPTTVEHCESNRKRTDLETERELNALFDGPTQKCSRRLSQTLSDCPSDNSFHESQGTLLEAKDILNKSLPACRSVNKVVCLGQDSTPVETSLESTSAKELKLTSGQTTQLNAVSATGAGGSAELEGVGANDFDDWEVDLLPDDSFLMQITQNPELIATPQNALGCVSSEKGENGANLRKPDSVQYTSNVPGSGALNKESIKTGTAKPVSLDTGGHLKTDAISSISKSSQNKTSGCHFGSEKSEHKNAQEGFTQLKCIPSTNFPKKIAVPALLQCNLPKPQTEKYKNDRQSVYHQSPVLSPLTEPHALKKVTHQVSTSKGHLKSTEVPKKSTFSSIDKNEALGSGGLWDTNCEDDDDDLLYQICDDVEKYSQSQVHGKENEKAKLVLGNITTLKQSPCLLGTLAGCYNFPEDPKHQVGRKTFSLDAPVISKKGELVDSSVQSNCVKFKAQSINNISGKLRRSNSVSSESFVSVTDTGALSRASLTINNMQGQNGFCSVNKLQNNCSFNQVMTEKSKYVFRNTSSSQTIVLDHKNENSPSCARINSELRENKDPADVTFQTPVNSMPLFKRHHSDSFSQMDTEQKSRKCSQEEIARKKEEALQRRKYKMQALLKNTAPT